MKHKIDFVKCNPTQNMTVLIKSKIPPDDYKVIAAKIMSYDNVYAEQVGFIEPFRKENADARLHMAGGEFCGNACMALAAYLANEQGLNQNETTELHLQVSGVERLVTCRITKNSGDYQCQVDMPLPLTIEQTVLNDGSDSYDMIVVRYSDFVHFVIEVEDIDTEMKRKMLNLVKLIGPLLDTKMLGILLYNIRTSELAPLIYVSDLDSAVWERGCGSGTASVGAYLAWKNQKSMEAAIQQPGGTIQVRAFYDQERLTQLEIEGNVGIVAQGIAFIEQDADHVEGVWNREISMV